MNLLLKSEPDSDQFSQSYFRSLKAPKIHDAKLYKLGFGHAEASLFVDQSRYIDIHMHKDDDRRVTFIDQRFGCFTFELITHGMDGNDA